MRRRTFVASGAGLLADAASGGLASLLTAPAPPILEYGTADEPDRSAMKSVCSVCSRRHCRRRSDRKSDEVSPFDHVHR